MNIAVLVKNVPDSQAVLKIGDDRKTVVTEGLNHVLNPYDEYAVEEALQAASKTGGKVTVYSLGEDGAVKALRNALAMGANEAVHVKWNGGLDMLGVAKALANAVKDGGYDLIFAGKQAIDDDGCAIGPMVAEILDIPHISAIHSFELSDDKVTAKRDIEGGTEVFESTMPVLLTAEKGLNEPRYASLKGIMMAKKKKIEAIEADQGEPMIEIIKLNYPPTRPPGKIVGQGVEAVPELVRLLKEEAKVL